jgi:hypothetical protein
VASRNQNRFTDLVKHADLGEKVFLPVEPQSGLSLLVKLRVCDDQESCARGLDPEAAKAPAHAARQTCPYSRARLFGQTLRSSLTNLVHTRKQQQVFANNMGSC